jgi:hypothetical protein
MPARVQSMMMHMAPGTAIAGSALQRLRYQELLPRVQVSWLAVSVWQQLEMRGDLQMAGCASHNAGHGAEHEAPHAARHSDVDGGECIAEVAIPGAAKGAGEMPCCVSITVRAACGCRNAGQGADQDEARHGARHSNGGECIAEVAILAAVKGAGEMPCYVSITAL